MQAVVAWCERLPVDSPFNAKLYYFRLDKPAVTVYDIINSPYLKVGFGGDDLFGLKLKIVDGDGDCLFNAVRESLDQTDPHFKDSRAIRHAVADYMAQHRHKFEGSFAAEQDETVDVAFDRHLVGMRNRAWGGEPEIRALANVVNRLIVVLENGRIRCEHKPSSVDCTHLAPIFIRYNGDNHYDRYYVKLGYDAVSILQHLRQQQAASTTIADVDYICVRAEQLEALQQHCEAIKGQVDVVANELALIATQGELDKLRSGLPSEGRWRHYRLIDSKTQQPLTTSPRDEFQSSFHQLALSMPQRGVASTEQADSQSKHFRSAQDDRIQRLFINFRDDITKIRYKCQPNLGFDQIQISFTDRAIRDRVIRKITAEQGRAIFTASGRHGFFYHADREAERDSQDLEAVRDIQASRLREKIMIEEELSDCESGDGQAQEGSSIPQPR